MTNSPPSSLLSPGLLAGVAVALAGEGELGAAAAAACGDLGAEMTRLPAGDEEAIAAALPDPLEVLVVDAAAGFAGRGLRDALDGAWVAVRAAGTARMIAAGGGKVVLLAPRSGAGANAHATRAGIENLARTLSIEWARHQVAITAIHPGADTAAAQVGELVAFLASPAGEYYSGCRFSLGCTAAPAA